MNAARKEPQIGESRRHDADAWTDATAPAPAAPAAEVPTQKLSMQFPADVHAHVKAGAALDRRGRQTMLSVLVEMCRARYMGARWPEDVVEQVQAQIAADADQAAAEDKPAAARKRRAG